MTAASSGATVKYRYGEMTWREVRDAAAAGRVAILPVATIEDHGHHLRSIPMSSSARLSASAAPPSFPRSACSCRR